MVSLAKIETENTVFGRVVNVRYFTPQGASDYKEVTKRACNDYYHAERFAFDVNTVLLRDKIIKWKNNLVYLSRYGYLQGPSRDSAIKASDTIEKHLFILKQANGNRDEILKAFDVLAFAVRCSRPHPESSRMKQYAEIANLMAEYLTIYSKSYANDLQ